MNYHNYTFINENDTYPNLYEYVQPVSAKILKLLNIIIKDLIPRVCPELLFRINSRPMRGDE
jgi:hypothetical protein